MDFRILGPLEVREGGWHLPLGGPKPRALLASLLLQANETVSSGRLIDEIWGERPPKSAAKLVQGYMSELRRTLGAPIETRQPGYRLRVSDDELDLLAFLRLAKEAREAARATDLERAAGLFSQALALWRGNPLADVELHGPSALEPERLAELRLSVDLDLIDVELARGRHGELVSDLEALAAAHPLQERPRRQLMLALYRSGRQAEALHAYRELRSELVEQLGLEPSEELRMLEAAILRQDPALAAPAPAAVDEGGAQPSREPPPEDARAPREERKLAAVLAVRVELEGRALDRDPESEHATRTAALERLEREVRRHEGVIEHVVGDRVLALFGIPQAHEDDADRAVRAAVSAVRSLAEPDGERPAGVAGRAAVEAGEVLVAHDGGGRRTLTGAPIGAAEQLLSAARPGQVVVGQAARAATEETVEYRALAAVESRARGWEVLRVREPHPPQRRPLELRAGLVGRDDELALLRHELELLRTDPRPRLVTVLGAAGVGKSRLAHELVRHAEALAPPVAVHRGRCLAYGNVSYSALADAVKAECGILADDPPEIVSDKIARSVERLFGDASAAPHVETLVGTAPAASLAREDLFDAWRGLLERVALRAPLLLVLEDLHWADDGLLDFVDHLTDWAEAPVLVLALARPELVDRRPTWGGGKRNAASITLEPLTPAETETLLAELLGAAPTAELARLFVERSEGNPLFGEEILRMLVDRGILRPTGSGEWELASEPAHVELPPSVRAVIGARLDALSPDEKEVVQAAAVVGRVFWVGAVQQLCQRSRRETRELLGRLRARDVLVAHGTSSFSGEPELAFRHVLIRDVAYESLPKRRRIRAHVEMAAWAAERGGREEDIAELLATHFLRALRYLEELGERDDGNLVRAAAYRWARAAGERAHRLWQQREAARWYREALEAAVGLRVEPAELARVSEAYAHACEGVEPYAEVASAFEAALAAYESIGDEAGAGRMEAWRAFVAFQSGDDSAVLRWSERALAHLEPGGAGRDLSLALTILGWAHRRSGRFDEAEPRLRRAVAIAESAGDPVIRAQASVSLGKCLQQSGNVDEGVPLLEQAVELSRRAGDLPVLLRALVDLSEAHEEATGDYRRAEELMREGLDLARRAGHRQQVAWMESNLADYLLDLGRLDEAEPLSRTGLEEARHMGEPRRIALTLPTVSYLALLRGRLVEAERFLDELRELTQEVREVYAAVWVPTLDGLLARAQGRREDAADILLEGARRQAGRTEIWGAVNLLAEAARSADHVGRPADGRGPREQLAALASWSIPARAFLAWVDGLLEPDPERALARLRDAVSSFERLERRLELGRSLADLARAEGRLGHGSTSTLGRAREILEGCGATLFVAELTEGGRRGPATARRA